MSDKKKWKGFISYYDLLFDAIVAAKCSTPGWGYKRAENFARKRLAEVEEERKKNDLIRGKRAEQ